MAYQVLARKWRPRTFATLVGQEHVVRALTHALNAQRLHHAYLLTGTRGVGKTTLARILAKALNCEQGITATPCGECAACQDIDHGRFADLIEVDAATNTRVEEMRQLLENAVYAPTRGRFKVYVIDEVHMLSTSAFNAMLKTLEEPPEHVKFILATTDPQKIPVTVLSRCLQFNLKQMPVQAIIEHLRHILQAENIPFDAPSLALIARAAAGSMRDALSLLDQAIAHGAGQVAEQGVRLMLGTVGRDFLFAILEAVAGAQPEQLLAVIANMSARSLSFAAALQELALLLTQLQVLQCVPQAVDSGDEDERARLQALAQCFTPEFVQLAYQIVNLGRQELSWSPDEEAGFTMTLLRLYTFRPDQVPPLKVTSKPLSATKADALSTLLPEASKTGGDPSQNLKKKPADTNNALAAEQTAEQSAEQTVKKNVERRVENTAEAVCGNSVVADANLPESSDDDSPLPLAPLAADFASSLADEPPFVPDLPAAAAISSAARSTNGLTAAPNIKSINKPSEALCRVDPGVQSVAHVSGVASATSVSTAPSASLKLLEPKQPGVERTQPVFAPTADINQPDWEQLIAQAKLSGLEAQMAKNCVLVSFRAPNKQDGDAAVGEIVLRLDEKKKYMLDQCRQGERLQSALEAYLGARCRLRVEIGNTVDTPAHHDEQRVVKQLEAAHRTLAADTFVREAGELMQFVVKTGSVRV